MDETRQRGSFIAKKRKELGLTQKQLAEQINVTDKAVSKWENGKGFPDTSLIKPLAQALHISVVELLDGKEVENEQLQEKTEIRFLDEISDGKKSKKRYRKMIALVVFLMGTALIISMLNRKDKDVTCEKFEIYTKDIVALLENVSECVQIMDHCEFYPEMVAISFNGKKKMEYMDLMTLDGYSENGIHYWVGESGEREQGKKQVKVYREEIEKGHKPETRANLKQWIQALRAIDFKQLDPEGYKTHEYEISDAPRFDEEDGGTQFIVVEGCKLYHYDKKSKSLMEMSEKELDEKADSFVECIDISKMKKGEGSSIAFIFI